MNKNENFSMRGIRVFEMTQQLGYFKFNQCIPV